ncbi:MAG: class I SAM-dependent methyltransferase family protein [Cenarchaeum sp. SB0665_bin_23]|nr:class I SAM-dependent methyltransferase family protein [Cenarchaeum sp. SB0667_bin_13]MXY61593.1 class I SAM-dependent methyltransferase family protein [Cenarchaeum sp. SB0665_bin_23]MXZ93976.1 class I SAM-dependent methyltransferase family protein [Cenarchaeum sp. SB0666_bin_15]MYB47025.1 class I SAM-dependent methyltransferase family protein [Cenarchaeum sp. SB0662_bin_33]MYC79484.1 class I SAM-dependent methyltransferase family protein [Cenarchaeum sp. SB0661_bin_35]MYD58242.1 class I SA
MTRFLKRLLADTLNEDELTALVSAFDQIGDIVIIRIPSSLYHRRLDIGLVLLNEIKIVNSVFCQITDVGGEYRTRSLELVAGRGGTKTAYRENGCTFQVDVERAFFTPRLATERARISKMVQPKEKILNMFGGVGMYTIQMAKECYCTVYNVDINPYATTLCIRNTQLNHLKGSVISVTDDASVICQRMQNTFDRVVMPLPERTDEFLDDAISAVRDAGIIHYYSHVHADRRQDAIPAIREHFDDIAPVPHIVLGSRLVRAVGPRYYQAVIDAKIHKVRCP